MAREIVFSLASLRKAVKPALAPVEHPMTVTKVCEGLYKVAYRDYHFEVTHFTKRGDGSTFNGWIMNDLNDHCVYSDPLDTKRAALAEIRTYVDGRIANPKGWR